MLIWTERSLYCLIRTLVRTTYKIMSLKINQSVRDRELLVNLSFACSYQGAWTLMGVIWRWAGCVWNNVRLALKIFSKADLGDSLPDLYKNRPTVLSLGRISITQLWPWKWGSNLYTAGLKSRTFSVVIFSVFILCFEVRVICGKTRKGQFRLNVSASSPIYCVIQPNKVYCTR